MVAYTNPCCILLMIGYQLPMAHTLMNGSPNPLESLHPFGDLQNGKGSTLANFNLTLPAGRPQSCCETWSDPKMNTAFNRECKTFNGHWHHSQLVQFIMPFVKYIVPSTSIFPYYYLRAGEPATTYDHWVSEFPFAFIFCWYSMRTVPVVE